MTTTNIAYRLPQVLADKIIDLRLAHGLTSGNNDTGIILKDNPHFSIKPSFYITNHVEFTNKLQNISLNSFDAKIVSLVVFKTRFGNTVVGVIEPSDNLRKIQQDIDRVLTSSTQSKHPEFEGENYIHHVTLGYSVPESQLEEFKKAAKDILSMEFLVDKLEVLATIDEGTDERECILTIESIDR